MHFNNQLQVPRSQRRSPAMRLREQLWVLARGQGEIVAHEERSWASVTFAGTRHRIEMKFEGAEAIEAGELFIAFLPEHEFAIPRQLVADAAIVAVDHRLSPRAELCVTFEMLLLDEE